MGGRRLFEPPDLPEECVPRRLTVVITTINVQVYRTRDIPPDGCPYYDQCLALAAARAWPSFTCEFCPLAVELDPEPKQLTHDPRSLGRESATCVECGGPMVRCRVCGLVICPECNPGPCPGEMVAPPRLPRRRRQRRKSLTRSARSLGLLKK